MCVAPSASYLGDQSSSWPLLAAAECDREPLLLDPNLPAALRSVQLFDQPQERRRLAVHGRACGAQAVHRFLVGGQTQQKLIVGYPRSAIPLPYFLQGWLRQFPLCQFLGPRQTQDAVPD